MAEFQIKFTAVQVEGNCKYYTLVETTGMYNDPDNLSGWDDGAHTSPNPAVSDILTAVLAIQDVSTGVVTSTDLDPLGANPLLYNVALNTINSSLTIDPTFFGLTINDNIPYGQYNITLHVTGLFGASFPQESFDQEPSIMSFDSCTLQCCVDVMFNDAMTDLCSDPCESKKLDAAFQAQGLLDAAVNAADQGDYISAVKLGDLVNEMCDGKCGCGCS